MGTAHPGDSASQPGGRGPPGQGAGDGLADGVAAEVLGDDGAVGADQEDRRDAADLVLLRDRRLRPGAEIALGPRLVLPLEEVARLLRRVVEAQAEQGEAPILREGVVRRLEVGDLGQARAAPGRPEVDQDVLAAVVGQRTGGAVECGDRERRAPLADVQEGRRGGLDVPQVERLVAPAARDRGDRESTSGRTHAPSDPR